MAIDRQKSPITARRISSSHEVSKHSDNDRSVSDTYGSSQSWGKNSNSTRSRSSRSRSNGINEPFKSSIKADSKQSDGQKKVSFCRERITIPHISLQEFSEEEHNATFVSSEELHQTKSKALLIADIVLETEVSDMEHSTRGLERIMYADQKLILRDQAYAAVLGEKPDIEMYKAFSLLSICDAVRAAEMDEEFARRYQSSRKGTKSGSGGHQNSTALFTLTEDGKGPRPTKHSSHSRTGNKELDAVAMFLSSPHGLRKKLIPSNSRASRIPVSIKVPNESASDEVSAITSPTISPMAIRKPYVSRTPEERKRIRSLHTPQPIAEEATRCPGPNSGRKMPAARQQPVRRRSSREGQVHQQVKRPPPPPQSQAPLEDPGNKKRSNGSKWAKQFRTSIATRGRGRSNSRGFRADQDDAGPKGLVSPRRMRSKSPNRQKQHKKAKPELGRARSDGVLSRSKLRSAKESRNERSKSPSWRKRFQRRLSFSK